MGGNGGNFQLNGSTLTVTLGMSATGYVIADAVRIEKLPMLLAAKEKVISDQWSVISDAWSGASSGPTLDAAAVVDAVAAGAAEWSRVDPSAAAQLSNVTVQIANLPGNVLGLASESTGRIWLDADAAGHGWAFNQKSQIANPKSYDLLTVVTHELGHVLGLPDLDPVDHPHDVMAGRLETGVDRHAFRADSSPSFNGLAPWLDRTQTADRLFDRLGESADSELDEMPQPSLGSQFAPASIVDGRIARAISERDEHEPFDRRSADDEDAIAADVMFEELLAGVD